MKKIYLIAWALLLGGAAKSQVVKPVSARVYTTAQGTDYRLRLTDTLRFTSFPQPLETEPCVFVDPARSFQTFLGIGGAITDASAEVFARLPQAKQEELLRAYYDRKEGIGYTLARTTIHSSDFSSGSYTYVAEGDSLLKTFSIAHDRQARLPLLQRAIRAAGGKLTLYVSPWSPPAWMKDNGTMLRVASCCPATARPGRIT